MGGNLTPNPFARINFDTPSIIQCILIECAFEIYHALKISQRTLVDHCMKMTCAHGLSKSNSNALAAQVFIILDELLNMLLREVDSDPFDLGRLK